MAAAVSGILPADIAIPCATQNELGGKDAKQLIDHGVTIVAEGANMPCSPEAIRLFTDAGAVCTGKGRQRRWCGHQRTGDAAERISRFVSFEHTEERLADIMRGIHDRCLHTAEEYGAPGNYVVGANIGGFIQVADAMLALGVI